MAQKRSNDAIVKGEDEKCPKKQLTMDFCLRQRLDGYTENVAAVTRSSGSAGDDTGGNDVETAGVGDDTGCEETPQKQKRTAAKSATKRSGGCWLVREKEMYNPFNYRCSKADGLREHWQEFNTGVQKPMVSGNTGRSSSNMPPKRSSAVSCWT